MDFHGYRPGNHVFVVCFFRMLRWRESDKTVSEYAESDGGTGKRKPFYANQGREKQVLRQVPLGMDMLRDTLESNRKKELELQKKKTLVLSLTHDINTPLSAIRLYTRALAEGLYTEEDKRMEAYRGIEKNVTDIEKYVNEITVASREDFLYLTVNLTEVYLSDVIEAIRKLYMDKFGSLHTVFEMEPYTDCLLKGDADRLIEVMQNLLENALKYGDGKRIIVSFSEEEDCRLITVTNSGCTLKQEELVNIFDSFYRGSNVEAANGSGLGLYISRQLMHKMDGEVYAEIRDDDFCATVVVRKA